MQAGRLVQQLSSYSLTQTLGGFKVPTANGIGIFSTQAKRPLPVVAAPRSNRFYSQVLAC